MEAIEVLYLLQMFSNPFYWVKLHMTAIDTFTITTIHLDG